jgi:hypothetical protein
VILYNTIVGLAAGVGLLLVAQLLGQFVDGRKVQPEGFALAFGITGFDLVDLGQGNEKSAKASAYLLAVLRPVSAWVFATGLMMASLVVAIISARCWRRRLWRTGTLKA